MKRIGKTMTIADVEDAILQGQEMHLKIVAEVEQEFYAPLIQFMEGVRNANHLPEAQAQTPGMDGQGLARAGQFRNGRQAPTDPRTNATPARLPQPPQLADIPEYGAG